jgi:hypothetical protein
MQQRPADRDRVFVPVAEWPCVEIDVLDPGCPKQGKYVFR